ncbi:MAG TPA: ABC transporter permease, partial [Polyangiaceae bacterium]|nr:ABC transporter permease [Polyangiaceae bacterium]
ASSFEPQFAELEARVRGRFQRRSVELSRLVAGDVERVELRRALSDEQQGEERPEWVVLHAAYDFSGDGATWGAVVGDYSNLLFEFRPPKPEGDLPGYYGRVLNALSASAKRGSALTGLDARTLDDPALGLSFATGQFESSAAVAGSYGIYNLSLMTGYDSRPRDGQPSDTVSALDWRTLRQQALAGTELLRRAGDSADLSLPRVFKAFATSKYPHFTDGESSGDYVGLQVTGTLSEDRPASGALLAVWPGDRGTPAKAWTSRKGANRSRDYEPSALEAVDEHGRFRSIGLREDMYTEAMTIGALFDSRGALTAISTQEQQTQKLSEAMRVNLFSGTGYSWTTLPIRETDPELLEVLKASADSPFRDNRALWGQLDNHGFVYVSEQVIDYRLKLFQPFGPVVLGPFDAGASFGVGVAPSELEPGARLNRIVARDLWNLNERRLSTLRARGVTSADLEILHARAKLAQARAKNSPTASGEEAGLLRSAALSQRVYSPLRSAMDDLVHAVVLLLLLAIPFSFALERLLLGATTIYGQIAGFSGCFLATFGALYLLHPGFAIASTPIIILLAFGLVLLSGMVTNIVIRKFRAELHAMQGQGGQSHDLEVSRAGTMLAAIAMGVSTMRRRPARTALTAVTVVMLTFTILCFASFSRTLGVRAVYQGPKDPSTKSALLLRRLDYSAVLPAVLDLARGTEGKGGAITPEYWRVHESNDPSRFSVARPDSGAALNIDAVISASGEELARWPELSAALGGGALLDQQAQLRDSGVFLPAVVSDVLKLHVGDRVRLNGREARFAGTFDAGRLQRLRQLDGESVLPINPDPGLLGQGTDAKAAAAANAVLNDEAVTNVVHLASDQVAVASPEFVQELGGDLRALNVYPGAGVDSAELGRRLSEMVAMPVWASSTQGVERLVFTVLTDVSAGFGLFVPLALGGLIIFGTLLGSISDREKEIYTFSALGLSPAHVGVLFFAEASVYAVVGGMGGQLLAELVGLCADLLARRGLIDPPGINYSSTNSLFAIALVMLTVLISAVYPAVRASRSANPGLARSFRVPEPEGDVLSLTFPFTVSAYDITGMVSFLAEHFRRHDDAGIGGFAASNTRIRKTAAERLELSVDLALAPFDLGVTQELVLNALPSEIPGVDEIALRITRTSGTVPDWRRQNKVFLKALRRQFLLWRTLSNETIEGYRLETLQVLGDAEAA